MKLFYRLKILASILILTACGKTVEVRENEVGVIEEGNKIRILNEGFHRVETDAYFALYELQPVTINFDFDVLFVDVSTGQVKFTLTFTPIAKALPDFYQQYKSDNMESVIQIELMRAIRRICDSIDSNDKTTEELEWLVNEEFLKYDKMNKYVNVDKVSRCKIELKK
jgi:hypothetical protein